MANKRSALAIRSALAAAALVLGISPAAARDTGELHSFHCLHGCPIGAPGIDDIVVRESSGPVST